MRLGMTMAGRAGAAMLNTVNRIEELRQAGLAKVRENELEEAIGFYDQALALCDDDDEDRELITINKADAMIALERSGPEVQELARVIMRRRNPRHVCLAAYALQYKHRLEADFKRALFYGQLALRAADEANDLAYKRAVLVDLGNIYEMDSQIDRAIESFQEALALLDDTGDLHNLSRGYTLENLGYCRLLTGEIEEGISTIHNALRYLTDPLGLVEAHVDLCYGYLESGDLEQARSYGEKALARATDSRHIRNSHYLLGEVAYTSGDSEKAEYHFDELARFYPEFRNLKSLLFAIDLRSMVNLKL
jgi:tetratricopeptide (TPR) repeat protein